jgi:mutator protein MutT
MKPGKDFIGVGCGAIIINDMDEVLLIKRSQGLVMEPGTWSRPGGRVEFGEKVEEAVRREIKEEIGIDVEVVRFLEITQTIEDGKHWISLGFLARHVSGTPRNMEPGKHDEMRWFPLSKLPENLNSYTRNAINVYFGSRR